MKKICSFTIIICLLISNVLASTTTYIRTKDDLQVASDIEVTNSNINLILKTPKVNEEEKTCTITVAPSQLSLAIGKEGQNARLAARLTGMKIDIKAE